MSRERELNAVLDLLRRHPEMWAHVDMRKLARLFGFSEAHLDELFLEPDYTPRALHAKQNRAAVGALLRSIRGVKP